MNFLLDSSYIIALLHPENPNHERAFSFLDQHKQEKRFASVLALAEVLTGPMKLSTFDVEETKVAFGVLIDGLFDIDEKVAVRVAEIKAKRGLKTADAVMAATADLTDTELITFDKELARKYTKARLLK